MTCFYGQGGAIPPLAFSATNQRYEGSAAQCVTFRFPLLLARIAARSLKRSRV